VPQQLEVILFALLSVTAFVATHYLLRKTVRKFGPSIVRPFVRRVLRPILTVYYRRKVTKEIQAERKAKGHPPLENQHIL
jgi:hypothetical protein